MGLSSSTSKTTQTPVYAPQLTGAAGDVSSVYHQNAGQTQDLANQIGGTVPGLLDQFKIGNPAVNAQRDYITSTLGGDPAHNPYLEQQIGLTNNDVANTTNAKLGTRGLTGGTVMQDILSRNLAQNESGLRYQDYSAEMARRAAAAGMAPGNAAAQVIGITPALAAAQSASSLPMDQATKYAASIGGLLGPYTNSTTKQSQSPFSILGGLLGAGLGGWASGGFKT